MDSASRNGARISRRYHGCGEREINQRRRLLICIFRHPNFVQIYGAASSGGIHATIFHDGKFDAVPLVLAK